MLLGHLWIYNEGTKLLSNKLGYWNLGATNTWLLPNPGHKGYIESVRDGKVLGLFSDGIHTDTTVVLETKSADMNNGQIWLRGMANDGYFTLQNVNSGKFMSAESMSLTVIRGKETFF